MIRPNFTEAVKRQVAARQQWKCNECKQVLSASFQVDHTTPLWKGGAHHPDNGAALCANCHAQKTQREEIERADLRRKAREEASERAAREHEAQIRRDENAKAKSKVNKATGIRECTLCSKRYYPLFKHKCRVVQQRIEERLNPAKPSLEAFRRRRRHQSPPTIKTPAREAADNPWARFYFVPKLDHT